jgi:hypothetical protein
MVGNVPTELPPKCWERKTRPMAKSFMFSSIVIGKISSPTFESLVKTETSSRTFFSFPTSVYRKEVGRGERQKSNNVLRYAPDLHF